DSKIDIAQEQALIEAHQHIILQFPLYWFSCPPLLKQWLDEVFAYGWAFGPGGDKLRHRKLGLAVSTGSCLQDYSPTGRYQVSLEEVLTSFSCIAKYVEADYQTPFAFYGANEVSDPTNTLAAQRLEQSAKDYLSHLSQLSVR